MTPFQLANKKSKQLLIIFKNKAICRYSEHKARSIISELMKRHGYEMFFRLRVEYMHILNGENTMEFDAECDRIINLM